MRLSLVILILGVLVPVTTAAQMNIWSLQNLGGGAAIHFDVTHTKDGVQESGRFEITTASSGNQVTVNVEAILGDDSCSSTTPLQSTQGVQMQLMMSCMTFAPVALALFSPTWAMFAMTSWELGSEMTMTQGGEQFSFRVTEECAHAGHSGVLAQLRTTDTEWDTCINPDMPVPLAVRMATDREVVQAVLTRYNRGR